MTIDEALDKLRSLQSFFSTDCPSASDQYHAIKAAQDFGFYGLYDCIRDEEERICNEIDRRSKYYVENHGIPGLALIGQWESLILFGRIRHDVEQVYISAGTIDVLCDATRERGIIIFAEGHVPDYYQIKRSKSK